MASRGICHVVCKRGMGGFEAAEIPLDDLINELLPKLEEDGVQPSVFRTPTGESVMPAVNQLIEDLRTEKAKYE